MTILTPNPAGSGLELELSRYILLHDVRGD